MNGNVTIALFGDCATHMAGEVYKHTRAVGLTNWLSIISPATENFRRLTQEKLEETELSDYYKRICFLNSNKNFLEYLLGEKADYLILDANDCRKQLIFDEGNHNGGACITDNRFMPDFGKCIDFMFGNRGGIRYVPSTSINRSEYRRAVEYVCREIKKVYNTGQIIINKHYYADAYIDNTGIHRFVRFLADENDETLALIKYIESLLEEELQGCHIIESPDIILGAAEHRFGIYPLHYNELYYEYVREALDVIFRGAPEESFMLKQLQNNYSMRFKVMMLEAQLGQSGKYFEREIDNIVKIGASEIFPAKAEDISEILHNQDDICGYLDVLYMLRDKIIIFLAVKDTPGFYVNGIILEKLKRLGFTNFPTKLWWMYVGVIFKGVALINQPADGPERPIEIVQFMGSTKVLMRSKSFRAGNEALIEMNGQNYCKNRRGINLVICNAFDGKIVDSVSYDSHVMDFFSRN